MQIESTPSKLGLGGWGASAARRVATLAFALGLTAVPWPLEVRAGDSASQVAPSASAAAGSLYGAGLTLDRVTPLAEVFSQPERFADEPILVSGRITDVCQKKGCWTLLRDGDAEVRVRFKDYGFFLPKDCRGQQAFVEGRVQVKELSAREARHYDSESQNADMAKTAGARREVGLLASGVKLVERGEAR